MDIRKTKYALLALLLLSAQLPMSAQGRPSGTESLRREVARLRQANDSLARVIGRMERNNASRAGSIEIPWDLLTFDSDEDPFHDAAKTSDAILRSRLDKTDVRLRIAYNDRLRSYVETYTDGRRTQLEAACKRYDARRDAFAATFARYGLPEFLLPLCIVESACTTGARSKAGALGMWQLMPATAREYGLTVDDQADERLDVAKSTDAAARVLKNAFATFGDWRLAIASYNCGPGNVQKAIAAAGSREWWAISPYLPKETRSYLPSLIAVEYYLKHCR